MISKARPNDTDVVGRASMAVSDEEVNMMPFDITGFIVEFGAGRFQEWYQMKLGNFSHVAIDPEIDTKQLEKNRNVLVSNLLFTSNNSAKVCPRDRPAAVLEVTQPDAVNTLRSPI
ncbi:hypothetical protein DL767_011447 [Monosporascus sp. MG133]|nr:hypothetical protein DL767_011447 [Monosporascus sp. MG133]